MAKIEDQNTPGFHWVQGFLEWIKYGPWPCGTLQIEVAPWLPNGLWRGRDGGAEKKEPPKSGIDSLLLCDFVRFFGKQTCNKSQNVCIDKVFDEHRLVEDQQFTQKDDGLKVRPKKSYTVVQQLEI